MMADGKQVSAPMRRRDQKLRWEESDTNLASAIPRVDNRKVKFQDGCVFLAACSSGDREEVKNLLERGADINTANVDGLTALHQACIDDNLDMVEFLVELGADVDVCDNEGWTPLHATASCAFTEIARYLIKQSANVAAVNNDGDLPYDIAENKEMENLLQDEMDKQGIDADAARCEEEERMLEDANSLLQDSSIKEQVHSKTGATPLHVAAAKGYLKVMNVLLRANVDINAEDVDGWTPLHAAVHWGQEDACKLLIEHFCEMMHKNHAGHTPFDLAEKDMRKLLEELKEIQENMRDKQDVNSEIIISSGHGRTRRSSVTRMSVDQKQNVIQRNLDEERASLAAYNPIKENTGDLINNIESSSASSTIDTTTTTTTTAGEGSETERKNERNKQVSQQLPSQPTSSSSRVETRRQDSMPKIDEVTEADRPLSTATTTLPKATSTSSMPPSPSVISDSTTVTTSTTAATTLITTSTIDVSKPVDSLSTVDSSRVSSSSTINDTQPKTQPQPSNELSRLTLPGSGGSGRDLVSRSISVPAKLPTQKDNSTPSSYLSSSGRHWSSSFSSSSFSTTPSSITTSTTTPSSPSSSRSTAPNATSSNDLSVPSCRQYGLRKTGSTSMVHERMLSEGGDNTLPRSASSPRLALDARLDSLQERLSSARRPLGSTGSSISTTATTSTTPTTDSDSKPERNSYTFGQSYTGYKSNYGGRSGNYVPYYQTRREAAAAAAAGTTTATTTTTTTPSDLSSNQRLEDRLSHLGESSVSSRLRDRASVASIGSPSPSTSSSVTHPTNSVFRRSYEPPKRDEETETQRKARAKHARQTRRSTQGVSLDDIEKAEQELKSNDASKITKNSSLSSSSTTTSSSSNITGTTSELDLKSIPSASSANTTLSASNTSSISSSSSSSPSTTIDSGTSRDDRSTSSLSSSSFRRRMGTVTDDKDNNDLSSADSVTSNLRSSHRRARHDVDTNSMTSDLPGSTDLTSNYLPRSQRNSSLLSTDGPGSTSQGVARSSSFRSSRLRNGDSMELTTPRVGTEDSSRKDKDAEGKEEKKEIHAIRARRQRRERRSTGIVMDNEDDGEKSKENKADEDKKDEALPSSRYSSRYASSSDVPSSDRSQRPVSYSDFSRSTGSLDIDYKKKYEDEKQENSRLRKELEDTKTNLRKAKDELDIAMKQKDMARNAERDKRALERRISELEEEMKKHQQDAETLKLDNSRLKEENGALIRVISKLSK